MGLFRELYAEDARHAFIAGSRVTGPNVFYNCRAITHEKLPGSEPHMKWVNGLLYDNVHDKINAENRTGMGPPDAGHGWAGANILLWNTEGELRFQRPDDELNVAVGHVGLSFRPRRPGKPGIFISPAIHVKPLSLFKSQRQQRYGIIF